MLKESFALAASKRYRSTVAAATLGLGNSMAATILEEIVQTKRREVEAARRLRAPDQLKADATAAEPPRDFYAAIVGSTQGRPALIAEIKKASPSAGVIRDDFDPVGIARAYELAGAAALSVLTDRAYFQGDIGHLAAAKSVVSIPVLRKDFIIDPYQVYESRAAGADAVLLIAEILTVEQIDEWSGLAKDLGMASLIEVHDEARLEAVLGLVGEDRRAILGINNRDLHRQRTDVQTTLRLAARLPPGTSFVAESGINTRENVLAMQQVGATALLVGECLLRASNPAEKIKSLFG